MSSVANHLLNALSSNLLQDLVRQSRPVLLTAHEILYTPAIQPNFAYFLTSGLASVVMTGNDGTVVDVETIGCEGMVGGAHLLGPMPVPSLCLMRLSGGALRIPVSTLRRMFLDSAELRGRVLEFVQMQTAMLAQIAACNRMHAVDQRLARMLLMVQDRAGGDTFKLTQEGLAEMLGTQRTTVSLVAAEMQTRGIVEYSRGRLRIVDRHRLEAAACSCYPATRELLEGLYRVEHRSGNGTQEKNHVPVRT